VLAKYQTTLGKDAAKAQNLFNAYIFASAIANNFSAKMDCGQAMSTMIDAFWLALKDTGVNKDCCNCCEGTAFINPSCGGPTPESTSYTFAAYPPDMLEVSVIGTDVTYTFLPDPSEIIRNTYNTVVTSSDGSVTVTPAAAEALPPVTTYNLSVAGQDAVWRFRLRVNMSGGSITTTVFRDQYKFPASGFWSASNPTVVAGSVAGVSTLEVGNLLDTLGASDQGIYSRASIVSENPVTPSSALAKPYELLYTMHEPAFAIQQIDLVFYDTKDAPHPTQGRPPAAFNTDVANGLTSMEIEFEIRAPR
jgi:hypothetical protein